MTEIFKNLPLRQASSFLGEVLVAEMVSPDWLDGAAVALAAAIAILGFLLMFTTAITGKRK